MTATYKHFGRVFKGKFIPADPVLFKNEFIQHEGKEIYVLVKKKIKQRTLGQHDYSTFLYTYIAKNTGMTFSAAKDAMKIMFLTITFKGIKTIRHTSLLSDAEMHEYLNEIKDWCEKFFGHPLPAKEKLENV